MVETPISEAFVVLIVNLRVVGSHVTKLGKVVEIPSFVMVFV